MTGAGTGSIVGVTGVTGKLDTITSRSDMFAMSGAQRSTSTRCDPTGAGVAVLMAGAAGAGGGKIPVRGGAAMANHGTTGTACLGVVTAGSDAGEGDILLTVNMGRPGGANGQSRIARRSGAVTDVAGIAGIQVFDMAARVIPGSHGGGIIAMTGITGADSIDTVFPDGCRGCKGVVAIIVALTAIGVTGNVVTGAGAGGGVGRGRSEVRRLDSKLESGAIEDVLESSLVVGTIEVIIIVTEGAGEDVPTGRTRVGSVRGLRLIFERGVAGRIAGSNDIDCRRGTVTASATRRFEGTERSGLVVRVTG